MNNECQLSLRHVHFRAQVTQFFATDADFLAHDSERNDAVQSVDVRNGGRPLRLALAGAPRSGPAGVGKPWLAIRQRSYAASKWSQLER